MSAPIKILFVVLALIGGFFAQDAWSWLTTSPKPSLAEHCQLSTVPCEQKGVSVSISRDVAQPLIPIQVYVEWPKANADSLRLTLEGHEMEMGTARFAIAKAENGQYQAEVLLPACTMQAMTWVGQLSNGQQSIDVAIRMAR